MSNIIVAIIIWVIAAIFAAVVTALLRLGDRE
jgi:hypothetical protein